MAEGSGVTIVVSASTTDVVEEVVPIEGAIGPEGAEKRGASATVAATAKAGAKSMFSQARQIGTTAIGKATEKGKQAAVVTHSVAATVAPSATSATVGAAQVAGQTATTVVAQTKAIAISAAADPKGTALLAAKQAAKQAEAATLDTAARFNVPLAKVALAKEVAKARFLEMTGDYRKIIMESLKEVVKDAAVADPDMWSSIKRAIRAAIDTFWLDLEVELERKLEKALLKQKSELEAPQRSCGRFGCCCAWLRSILLYHFLPCDKSIFGKLKDPIFWILTLMSAIPTYGIRSGFFSILLFCIVFPMPPDEFQLVNFIIQLKGSQFFTVGFLQSLITGGTYFYCSSLDTDRLGYCIRQYGPGSSQHLITALVDYVANILLCWIAFWSLPFSEKNKEEFVVAVRTKEERETLKNRGSDLEGGGEASGDEEAMGPTRSGHRCCCCRINSTRGGRLRTLLFYDMFAFLLSAAVMMGLTALLGFEVGKGIGKYDEDGDGKDWGVDPQLKANLYIARVLYALLTFPFAVFLIPVVSTILTHCDQTGFNRRGACVFFRLPVQGARKGAQGGGAVVFVDNNEQDPGRGAAALRTSAKGTAPGAGIPKE